MLTRKETSEDEYGGNYAVTLQNVTERTVVFVSVDCTSSHGAFYRGDGGVGSGVVRAIAEYEIPYAIDSGSLVPLSPPFRIMPNDEVTVRIAVAPLDSGKANEEQPHYLSIALVTSDGDAVYIRQEDAYGIGAGPHLLG